MAIHPRYRSRSGANDRPNVLILMSDQHRHDLMICAGRDRVATPNLDRVAADGVRYANAYCVSPLCLPSRMSFLTGEYPSALNLAANHTWLDHRHRTLAHHFAEAGYLSALIGKMHFGDACKHGFDHYLSINDWLSYLGPKVKHYADEIAGNPLTRKFFDTVSDGGSGFPDVDELWDEDGNFWQGLVEPMDMTHPVSELDADDTLDMFVARETVKFMRRYRDEPFMLIAGFMRPHPPMYPPRPWDELYPPETIERTQPQPLDSYPELLQRYIAKYADVDETRYRADRAGYYGNLAFLDHCVGRVLDSLDDLGLRDNTIVIYCSDHGDMEGEHGLMHKGVMYDPSVKIPLIISSPAHLPRGEVDDALVSMMDLYPTLAQLCGLEKPQGIAARSFIGNSEPRDAVFAELNNSKYMVRTARHKLVYQIGGGDQLFDLETDPGECINLVGDPAVRDVEQNLRDRLTAELHPPAAS